MSKATDESMTKGPVAWMAGHTVTANLLMFALLVGGLFAAFRVKQEVFPDLQLDQVQISVAYPGASPEEVEKGVVLVIEESVQGLDGVEEVRASAKEGMGSVTVKALEGANTQKLFQDVQNEIERITSFPEEAEQPQITLLVAQRQVLKLLVYGDLSYNTLRGYAEDMRDELIQSDAITKVEINGVPGYEVAVEIPQENLRRYNLTLDQVAAIIRAGSLELPGGRIKSDGGDILIRVDERRDWAREFIRLPIITGDGGGVVYLGDIATVTESFADDDLYAFYEGQPAVRLEVFRVGDETPVSVSDAVKAFQQEWAQSLPDSVKTVLVDDRSVVFKQRFELLARNGLIGLVLVLVLLGLFLEIRLAFWVAMGIPISFLGTFIVMPLFGTTLNMVSMFAFIISLGIVVDDAIVVGENIYKYHQRGLSFLQAAIKGAREVALPVTFSVLTNIVAFLPMSFVPGTMGKVFKVIPVVVISAFAISLIESVFILPAHLGHQKEKASLFKGLHHFQQKFSRWFMRMVQKIYGPILEWSIHHRYVTSALAVGMLIITIGYMRSGRIGAEIFPKVESDFAVCTVTLPIGSPLDQTRSVVREVTAAAHRVAATLPEGQQLDGIYTSIGYSSSSRDAGSKSTGGHVAEVMVYLVDPEIRAMGTEQFVRSWRQQVGELPGLESILFQSDAGGPGAGSSIDIGLTHRDLNVLQQAGEELAAELAVYSQVSDINDGFLPGKKQLDFKLTPLGRELGLTVQSVASQLRGSYYGAEALRQQRGRNEVKVMVRLPEAERQSEFDLIEKVLLTPTGEEVLLRDAVTIERGRSYTNISRLDGRRIIQVTANVTPQRDAENIMAQIKAEVLPNLVQKHTGLSYTFEGKMKDMADSMKALGLGLLAAVVVVYVLLAIPFNSYLQPLIIMVSIPFGIVGAVIGHVVMEYSLSMMTMFGVVALSGVVVNDSLVLIEFANREREKGRSSHVAIHAAGILRFRPIMLTTLSTFFGLAPMILEKSMQAKFLVPMAISLGFGILFATLITLILVPSLYMIVDDFHRIFEWLKRGELVEEAPTLKE